MGGTASFPGHESLVFSREFFLFLRPALKEVGAFGLGLFLCELFSGVDSSNIVSG